MDTSLDRELDLPEYRTFAPELDRLERNKLDSGTSQRQDTLAALKEANKRATGRFQLENQGELSTWRPGRILHVSELMRLLRLVCSNPRLADRGAVGMVGLSVEVPGDNGAERKYVCAVPPGNMPEYSKVRVGEHGEAVNEQYRGWRTILLRLLEIGATTESKLVRVFGDPTAFGSGPYLQQVQALRK